MKRFKLGGESTPLAAASKLSSATPSNGPQSPARNARSLIFLIGTLLLLSGCTKKQPANNSIPKSIVALSPAAVEILYSINAENQIAAVCEFCDYPPEASKKPVAGGFDGKSISLETILSFNPDFIYLTDGMHNFLIPMLENLGIKYYLSNANSIEAIQTEILQIGQITGHSSEAEKTVTKMKDEIINFNNTKSNVSVYYEVWNNPYISCGNSSFINDVISVSGGNNIFSDLAEPYPQVSVESIIARNPEIIFITQSSGISAEEVKNRTGWKNINAVKNNQIYIIDDNLSSRPSPRITQIIQVFNNYILTAK